MFAAYDPQPFAEPILESAFLIAASTQSNDADDSMRGMSLTSLNSGSKWIILGTIKECIYGLVVQAQCSTSIPDPEVSQLVAIKIMYWDRIAARSSVLTEACRNALNEVSAMQLMRSQGGHPNVLDIIEVLSDDKAIYLILPWCGGGELYDFVRAEKRLSEEQARPIFKQIVEGVHFLHQSGVRICHRDLSPENILLSNDRKTAKVIDFGHSILFPVITGGLFTPQCPFGKTFYQSPEIFMKKPFDGAAIEVWTLGMVLFVMLTGAPLYVQPQMQDKLFTMVAVNHNLSGLLRLWRLNLTDEAIDLVQGCLKYEPLERLTIPNLLAHPWCSHNNLN